tara:strand:+ start:5269 stop:5724 length:456 start_codon:yes stop_codon:yes gene_type:complete
VPDNAYYIPNESSGGPKLPSGKHKAIIVALDVSENIKCGGFIADIFKPVYRVVDSEYANADVKDNGVFRYKDKPGYNFEASRNWGFAKFCTILGLDKKQDGKITLPYLEIDMIDGVKVLIEVSYKSFVNDSGKPVRYPIALLKTKLGDVPF